MSNSAKPPPTGMSFDRDTARFGGMLRGVVDAGVAILGQLEQDIGRVRHPVPTQAERAEANLAAAQATASITRSICQTILLAHELPNRSKPR